MHITTCGHLAVVQQALLIKELREAEGIVDIADPPDGVVCAHSLPVAELRSVARRDKADLPVNLVGASGERRVDGRLDHICAALEKTASQQQVWIERDFPTIVKS